MRVSCVSHDRRLQCSLRVGWDAGLNTEYGEKKAWQHETAWLRQGATAHERKGAWIRVALTAAFVLGIGLAHTGSEARAQGEVLPETTITSGPGETHRLGSADFAFSSSDGAASFECSLDGAGFEPCEPWKPSTSGTARTARGTCRRRRGEPRPDSGPVAVVGGRHASERQFRDPARGWNVQGYPLPAWKPATHPSHWSMAELRGKARSRCRRRATPRCLRTAALPDQLCS